MKRLFSLQLVIIILFFTSCNINNAENSSTMRSSSQNNGSSSNVNVITLFFSSKNSNLDNLYAESREVVLQKNYSNEEYAVIIMQELLKGPKASNLNRTMNEAIKVKSVKIKDKTATVDLNHEMSLKTQGSTGERIAINSIIATLTELDFIEKILITVEGKTYETGHNVYDTPLSREDFSEIKLIY